MSLSPEFFNSFRLEDGQSSPNTLLETKRGDCIALTRLLAKEHQDHPSAAIVIDNAGRPHASFGIIHVDEQRINRMHMYYGKFHTDIVNLSTVVPLSNEPSEYMYPATIQQDSNENVTGYTINMDVLEPLAYIGKPHDMNSFLRDLTIYSGFMEWGRIVQYMRNHNLYAKRW